MKWWKGLDGTSKEGQCGTMEEDGFVPDSTEATKAEYQDYIKNIPIVPVVESDLDKLVKYAKKEKWI